MDRIYAPWRIEWIKRDDQNAAVDGCVFCALPQQDADRENLIVARSEHAFVMLNNYPYNPGHTMVIPRPHLAAYEDLPDDVRIGHAALKARTFAAMNRAFEPDGYNAGVNLGTGSGGSITEHLHTHIVPRWEGDTNFMPVIANTKVIVEAVETSYDHLHEAFAELEDATLVDDDQAVRVG